jgi:hypothetical protein
VSGGVSWIVPQLSQAPGKWPHKPFRMEMKGGASVLSLLFPLFLPLPILTLCSPPEPRSSATWHPEEVVCYPDPVANVELLPSSEEYLVACHLPRKRPKLRSREEFCKVCIALHHCRAEVRSRAASKQGLFPLSSLQSVTCRNYLWVVAINLLFIF